MNALRLSVITLSCCAATTWAQTEVTTVVADSTTEERGHAVHRIEADVLPGAILHTNEFLKGGNYEKRTMNHAFSARLKYAFMPPQDSRTAHIYKGVYQGVGVAYNEFNPQLGNPVSAYLFQGARIASLSPRLTLNYEWNLGMTFGWNPYDPDTNSENMVIGSKTTAYIGLDLYLALRLSDAFDINLGANVAHYSNGNTQFPNAGLNTAAARLSLAYYVGRKKEVADSRPVPKLRRHVSYDLTLFGSWRRRGYYYDNQAYALPGSYGVLGFGFSPMYNLNHWLNVGASVDGVYDKSANMVVEDDGTGQFGGITRPARSKQMALGLSGRVEFVMPYFTINMGLGHNVINASGSFKGVYETLALKIGVTRELFLNIGYCLNNFKNPNYLMLGFGLRFNHQRDIK